MTPDIIQYASDTFENIENNKEFVGAPLEYILYYKEYSKGNISNLFYLLLLPYTFGILVANLVIDFVKRKNMKYANESLNNIHEIKSNNFDYAFEYYMKRYLYHGGEKWKYDMIIRQVEMEKNLYELKNTNEA